MTGARPMVWTVGHGTQPAERLVELLAGVPIERVVDIRRFPGSRHNPQYGREAMEAWLPEARLDYRWSPRLGGRRRPSPDSPHTALRNDAFRAYAEHMETAEFLAGIDELLELADAAPTTVMCSESVWWRCHRRLVADHLTLVRGLEVRHVMPDGRISAHRVTDGARLVAGHVRYDVVTAPTS